ncbi:hypothetical protein KIF59_22340 [Enterobacter cloacae subsp. cloacae]|nr:hypothetical protein [Enterobacter cloacae subsp. cloacae]
MLDAMHGSTRKRRPASTVKVFTAGKRCRWRWKDAASLRLLTTERGTSAPRATPPAAKHSPFRRSCRRLPPPNAHPGRSCAFTAG